MGVFPLPSKSGDVVQGPNHGQALGVSATTKYPLQAEAFAVALATGNGSNLAQHNADFGAMFALTLLAALPVLAFFFAMENRFVAGLASGATKVEKLGLAGLTPAAEPLFYPRHVDDGQRFGKRCISDRQRLHDRLVLRECSRHRVLLRQPPPNTGTNGVPRERLEKCRQIGVAGQANDRTVKLQVVSDETFHARLVVHGADLLAKILDDVRRHMRGGQSCRGGLKKATHGEEFQHRRVVLQIDHKGHGLKQKTWFEARDIRPVTLANIEDPDNFESLDGFPHGAPGETETFAQFLLRGQSVPGGKFAVEDHLLNLEDRDICNGHADILSSAPTIAT